MKKKILFFILIIGIFTACSLTSEDEEKVDHMESTADLMPSTLFSPVVMPVNLTRILALEEGCLYYLADSQQEEGYCSVFKQSLVSEEEEVEIRKGISPSDNLLCMTVDKDNNCYYFGYEMQDREKQYYLEKRDSRNEQIFIEQYEKPVFSVGESFYKVEILADDKGNICIYNQNGSFFFLNPKGKLTGKQMMEDMPAGKFAHAGDEGIYFYTVEEELAFYPVLIEKGEVQTDKVSFVPYEKDKSDIFVISGRGSGLYLSCYNSLWNYHPESNEKIKLFSWSDSNVNIMNTEIQYISVLDDTRYLVISEDFLRTKKEKAVITMSRKEDLPRKITLTLGTVGYREANDEALLRVVSDFNRQSQDWTVEIIDYSENNTLTWREGLQALYLDLIQKKGPDLLSAGELDVNTLHYKGVWEDLKPYFNESERIGQEDILQSLWNAGCMGDKMEIVIPWFSIGTLIARQEENRAGWTAEEFLDMEEQYEGQHLLENMTPDSVLEVCLQADLSEYIDYQKRTCTFSDERFKTLLTEINDWNYPERSTQFIAGINKSAQDFKDGKYLSYTHRFIGMQDFVQWRSEIGDSAALIGYPNSDKKPYYRIQNAMMFGMNSASEQKDGAWAFIEFMLEEEQQTWSMYEGIGFPVRKDAFREYISTLRLPDNASSAYSEYQDEDIEQLLFMAENSYWNRTTSLSNPVMDIIREETEAYFTEDKTLEVTVDIIQSRVQLYLDENDT